MEMVNLFLDEVLCQFDGVLLENKKKVARGFSPDYAHDGYKFSWLT